MLLEWLVSLSVWKQKLSIDSNRIAELNSRRENGSHGCWLELSPVGLAGWWDRCNTGDNGSQVSKRDDWEPGGYHHERAVCWCSCSSGNARPSTDTLPSKIRSQFSTRILLGSANQETQRMAFGEVATTGQVEKFRGFYTCDGLTVQPMRFYVCDLHTYGLNDLTAFEQSYKLGVLFITSTTAFSDLDSVLANGRSREEVEWEQNQSWFCEDKERPLHRPDPISYKRPPNQHLEGDATWRRGSFDLTFQKWAPAEQKNTRNLKLRLDNLHNRCYTYIEPRRSVCL